jgi:hypothetical protein
MNFVRLEFDGQVQFLEFKNDLERPAVNFEAGE